MPSIYLSPSLQEFNPYIGGGNEEYYMNLIADAMMPYLIASGIEVVRNNPNSSLAQTIAESNAGNFDLHFAIHSNASPEYLSGTMQGSDFYYYAYSPESQRAADIFAENMKLIYPNPNLVKTVPTTTLAELRNTKAPAVLAETAYHDNYFDAQWMRDNIELIASNYSVSVTEFLGVPFVNPYY